MVKIALIVVWYGNFPNYFDFWIESAKRNDKFDFIIITNNNCEDKWKAKNIFFHQVELTQFNKLASMRLGEKIRINLPYKLCDLRPAYGYIFEEYLKGYTYWGHTDIDVIYGDLNKFLLPYISDLKYDKIFDRGHFTLYKNDKETNSLFKTSLNGTINYLEIFNSSYSYGFDESNRYSITSIYNLKGKDYLKYIPDFRFDVNTKFYKFKNVETGKKIAKFFWDNGNLYTIDNDNIKVEIGYAHFQKRSLQIRSRQVGKSFYIFPNYITSEDIKEKICVHTIIIWKFRQKIKECKMKYKLILRKIFDERRKYDK